LYWKKSAEETCGLVECQQGEVKALPRTSHLTNYIFGPSLRFFFAFELILLQTRITLADDALDLRELASCCSLLARVWLAAAMFSGSCRGLPVLRLESFLVDL
jgi:hypothetical protein